MNRIKAFFMHKTERDRAAYVVMLVFSLTALTAAFTLSVEKIEILMNPKTILPCTINLILDCGKVMETPQSHIFGFPNMFIGLMAYPILIAVALAALGGTKFPKWYLRAAHVGITLGALFAYFLFFSSVYAIQVLCPWCLVVTFSTTLILSAFTHIMLRNNVWNLKKATNAKVQSFLAKGYGKLATFIWVFLLIALVFLKFGTALFA